MSRILSRNKEKEEELDVAQQSETRQFRASEVPKHVFEPVFKNMVEQFPNRSLSVNRFLCKMELKLMIIV